MYEPLSFWLQKCVQNAWISKSKSDKMVVYVLLKDVKNCRKIVFPLERTVTRPYLFSSKSPCTNFPFLQNLAIVRSNTPERTRSHLCA